MEYAQVHDNLYGRAFADVQAVVNAGYLCIIECDIQGAEKLKNNAAFQPYFVFVRAPSMQHLRDRLVNRFRS